MLSLQHQVYGNLSHIYYSLFRCQSIYILKTDKEGSLAICY